MYTCPYVLEFRPLLVLHKEVKDCLPNFHLILFVKQTPVKQQKLLTLSVYLMGFLLVCCSTSLFISIWWSFVYKGGSRILVWWWKWKENFVYKDLYRIDISFGWKFTGLGLFCFVELNYLLTHIFKFIVIYFGCIWFIQCRQC